MNGHGDLPGEVKARAIASVQESAAPRESPARVVEHERMNPGGAIRAAKLFLCVKKSYAAAEKNGTSERLLASTLISTHFPLLLFM